MERVKLALLRFQRVHLEPFSSSVSIHLGKHCDVLRDLVPFAHFKKREKTLGSVTFTKMQDEACNYTKNNTPPCVFFTFFKLY